MNHPVHQIRVAGIVVLLGLTAAGAGGSSASDLADEDAPADQILIRVRDAASNQPIPEFHILAGVKSRVVSSEFAKQTGKEIVSWQPHTIREGRDGTLAWPLKQAYDVMALRIEADGFTPATSAWVKKSNGACRMEILLQQDTRVSGRVLQPDGKPAAKAMLAIALPQKDAVLVNNGRLRSTVLPLPETLNERWRRPGQFESDDVGEYRVPTETDPGAAVLILHESGVAEMPYTKFAASRKITLQGWGRIEGRVLWKDRADVDEEVSLTIHRDEYGYPGTIAQYANATTDSEGRFEFDRVLPGRAQVSRGIKMAGAEGGSPATWNFPGLYAHVDVRSGDPTRMLIGGQGRKVTGRLTGRTMWRDVTFHFHPTAPRAGGLGRDNGWQAFGQFRSSPFGHLFFRDKLQPKADGTFEITDMLPGRYQFFVSEANVEGYVASHTIVVEQETPGEHPAALDVGEIKLKPQ